MKLTRTKHSGSLVALVVISVVAVLLAGCGGQSSSKKPSADSGAVDRNANLRIGSPVPQSLDPRAGAGTLNSSTWTVYDRLLLANTDKKYVPMLATEWNFSEDGKTLTLKLRKGVTFTDGTPFNAEAVKANLDFSRAAKDTALAAQVADIAEVAVVDDYTVDLRLSRATTKVLGALSSHLGGLMISPKALENPADLATKPVGTGAYVLESFQPGQKLVFTRRTDKGGIWDKTTGGPAKVTIQTMDDDSEITALKSGQIDLASSLEPPTAVQNEIDAGRLEHTPFKGGLLMAGINFDKTKPPFNNPLVRQAVNYAIDRKAIVEAFNPFFEPRVQPWPKGLDGFDDSREDTYSNDPDKARELLAEAGYPDGVDAGEMLVPTDTKIVPLAAEAVQAGLAEVGINLKLRNVDIAALFSDWPTSKASAYLYVIFTVGSIEPATWLFNIFANPTTVKGVDKKMEDLVNSGVDDSTLTAEQRTAKVSEAVDYATEQALYAPIWQGDTQFIHTPKVENVDKLDAVSNYRNVYISK